MRIIPEAPAPEVMADDGDAMLAVALFFRQKVAPLGRLHTEQRKQICGYEHALNPLRPVAAGEVEVLVLISRELREHLLLIAPGEEVIDPHVKLAADLRAALPQHHQS